MLAHSSLPLNAALPPMSFLAGVGAVRAKRPLPLAAKLALLLLALLYEAYYCNAEAKKKKKTKTTMTRRYFTILSTIKAKACLPHYIAAAMKLQLPPPPPPRPRPR